MMRNPRRLVAAMAASALVAAGGLTAGLTVSANASTSTTCASTDTADIACQIQQQEILNPSAITLDVTLKSGDGKSDQYIRLSWTGSCVKDFNGDDGTTISNPLKQVPISTAAAVSVSVPLPYPDPYYCIISVDAELQASLGNGIYTTNTTGSFRLALDYTSFTSPSPAPTANVPLVKGYGGKCLDDKANSAANRAEVIIWTCNSSDPSQAWKFTNGELVHNGKCANDPGHGGSGTKVILWTCTHASNETWTHTSGDGEFVLGSRSHGRLCLTDPGHSTANRTQLTVSACQNTSNQHWT
jgi:ricin-type beta-trefoil lectin protein